MTTYSIYSKQGADYGLWPAPTEAAALYNMHECLGYGHVVSYDEANDKLIFLDDETKYRLGDVEDWVIQDVEDLKPAPVKRPYHGIFRILD